MRKTPDEGYAVSVHSSVWDPYRLVSLVLKSLFCMHKTADEGWDP